MLAHGVGHGGDEPGDDLEFVLGEAVQDGVGAVAEGAEERQAGGLALVGSAVVGKSCPAEDKGCQRPGLGR